MPAPIVFRPQYGAIDSMLLQMFVNKFTHKQNMELVEKKLEYDELQLKKKQAYDEATQLDKEARDEARTLSAEDRASKRPAYKEGQLLDFSVGDQNIQHKYSNGKWNPTGVVSPRYKPASVNINLAQSSASERENLATGEAALSTLDNLRGLYSDAFTGPVAGRIGKVKDVFGGNTDKQSEFNAATSAFKNQIIKEITGAQMSEPEAKRIMKQVPDVNDPPSVWKAKWKQSRRNISVLRKKRLEVMEKSGVKTPKNDTYDFEYVPGKGLVPSGGK